MLTQILPIFVPLPSLAAVLRRGLSRGLLRFAGWPGERNISAYSAGVPARLYVGAKADAYVLRCPSLGLAVHGE